MHSYEYFIFLIYTEEYIKTQTHDKIFEFKILNFNISVMKIHDFNELLCLTITDKGILAPSLEIKNMSCNTMKYLGL